MPTERAYQAYLIKELKQMFPGCIVLKNDSDYIQGIPDLLILWKTKWAALEVKASERSAEQPNQDYYIRQMDDMSFAAFIYPSIEEEVLDALQQTLRTGRSPRFS
jgi:hypothetical protein